MVGPSARSAKSVYPLVSKSRVGNWIMIAMLLIAVLATFLAPRKDKFVVTVGVACFLLVGMSALTVWVLRRPNERIEADEEGIAAFDEGNKEVCRMGWKEVTSYGSELDPTDPKRVEMVLKGSGGQI